MLLNNMMKILPGIITIKGVKYILEECQYSEHIEIFPNWWCFTYWPLDDSKGLPPKVHNQSDWYYLTATEETKEEAYNDMLERVNGMLEEWK